MSDVSCDRMHEPAELVVFAIIGTMTPRRREIGDGIGELGNLKVPRSVEPLNQMEGGCRKGRRNGSSKDAGSKRCIL